MSMNDSVEPTSEATPTILHQVSILMSDTEQIALKQMVLDAPDDAVFVEYGCGGSTCIFALTMRGTQQLHSIEHTREWFDRIGSVLGALPLRGEVFLHWKPAGDGRPLGYKIGDNTQIIEEHNFRVYGTPSEELPHGLDSYIHAKGTNINWSKVHCVLVDGVARGAVLAVLRHKLPAGAIVILHDAALRVDWYRWAVNDLYEVVQLVDNMLWLRVPKNTQ